MKIRFVCLFTALFSCCTLFAQEFNARLTVNSDKIEGTNKELYTTLQNDLNDFLNNRVWSDAIFENEERIDCQYVLTIDEAAGSSYSGSLQVSAVRTVFNSSYTTPIFNFKDNNVKFVYSQFDRLEFNVNNIESNLMAILAYYSYVVLGVHFDSYSRMGGQKYFDMAERISNLMGTSEDEGWKPFGSDHNRYALISNYQDAQLRGLRELIYEYHRMGLDMMTVNTDNAKSLILEVLPSLQTMNSSKPFSVALQQFAECKIDELVDIFRSAPANERQKVSEILQSVLPTRSKDFSDLTNSSY